MDPFYGWGSTTSRLEPLRGGSLRNFNIFWCSIVHIILLQLINLKKSLEWFFATFHRVQQITYASTYIRLVKQVVHTIFFQCTLTYVKESSIVYTRSIMTNCLLIEKQISGHQTRVKFCSLRKNEAHC